MTDTLKDMVQEFGDRPGVVARELTKLHEEFKRGMLSELLIHYGHNHPRGEICLLVAGISKEEATSGIEEEWCELSVREHVASLVEQGHNKKGAIKLVAQLRGMPKREVYAMVHGEDR